MNNAHDVICMIWNSLEVQLHPMENNADNHLYKLQCAVYADVIT